MVGAAPRVGPFWFGMLAVRDGPGPDDEIDAYYEDAPVLLRTLRELVRSETAPSSPPCTGR